MSLLMADIENTGFMEQMSVNTSTVRGKKKMQ
jgi:hypothetical protein